VSRLTHALSLSLSPSLSLSLRGEPSKNIPCRHQRNHGLGCKNSFKIQNLPSASQFLSKTGLSCWVTRMKVVRLLISLISAAPTYVQAERRPPNRSSTVASTGPL